MSDQFNELFQEILRDHFKHPRYRAVLNPNLPLFENPSCGDQVRLQVKLNENIIENFSFDGSGCSISMASADMLCEILTGKTVEQAFQIIDEFLKIMRGELETSLLQKYGDLEALAGVAQLPVRVKCATLAWNGAKRVLELSLESQNG
jgi:nitrogen fixation NifU-like protein